MTARLTIKNLTSWQTRDLRTVIAAGLRAAGPGDGRRYHVTVTHTRGQHRGCSGYAYYHSGTIRMRIPPVGKVAVDGHLPEPLLTDFARVLVHEIGHTIGLKHGEMAKCRSLAVPWVDSLTIRAQAPKASPAAPSRVDTALAAVERITGRIEAAERKHKTHLRRLRTLLAKAKRSATYYTNKAASVPPAGPGGPINGAGATTTRTTNPQPNPSPRPETNQETDR